MVRKRYDRIIASVLTAAMAVGGVLSAGGIGTVSAAEESGAQTQAAESFSIERLSSNYTKVSAGYRASDYQGESRSFSVEDVMNQEDTSVITSDNYGYDGRVADVSPGVSLRLNIEAPETALYWLGFDYLSYDESILPIEFSLKIDGEYPFYEARNLNFETTWVQSEGTSLDRYGNEIVSMPSKLIQWESKYLSDSSYRYAGPLKVELEKGSHELEIQVSEGSFLLGNVALCAPEEVPEYTGSQKAPGDMLITIQGEKFYLRNDSSIHATSEYDGALYPLSSGETVLNTVDGDSFMTAGQAITWQFDVIADGYYYIAMNYRQSDKNDFPVFVDWRIDGEIPNAAFLSYPVESTAKYATRTLKDAE